MIVGRGLVGSWAAAVGQSKKGQTKCRDNARHPPGQDDHQQNHKKRTHRPRAQQLLGKHEELGLVERAVAALVARLERLHDARARGRVLPACLLVCVGWLVGLVGLRGGWCSSASLASGRAAFGGGKNTQGAAADRRRFSPGTRLLTMLYSDRMATSASMASIELLWLTSTLSKTCDVF